MPRTRQANATADTKLAITTSLALSGIALLILFMAGCERMHNPTSNHSELALQDGMGMLEAAGALGCEGHREASGMRTNPTVRPADWNVEWRIGCVYDVDDAKVVAVYAAWGSEDSEQSPPSSAYRLVDWSTEPTQDRSPIALWSSDV